MKSVGKESPYQDVDESFSFNQWKVNVKRENLREKWKWKVKVKWLTYTREQKGRQTPWPNCGGALSNPAAWYSIPETSPEKLHWFKSVFNGQNCFRKAWKVLMNCGEKKYDTFRRVDFWQLFTLAAVIVIPGRSMMPIAVKVNMKWPPLYKKKEITFISKKFQYPSNWEIFTHTAKM